MHRGLSVAILIPLVVAGCLAPAAPVEPEAIPDVKLPDVVLLPEDRAAQIDVPVRVVLVGFAEGTAEALQTALTPAKIDHDFLHAPNGVTQPESNAFFLPVESIFTNPLLPVAQYKVEAANATTTTAILAFAAASKVADAEGTLYDGRAVEAMLATTFAPAPATPILVVLHGGETLGAEHGWRYTYETGWLDDVRIFGGLLPVLVYDASALPDPYVTRTSLTDPAFDVVFGPVEPRAYDYPIENGGDATVEALAQAATDAAHFRLLQGPIYPVTTAPCHSILVYVGVRATALAHRLGSAEVESLVDSATITSAFRNLTGESVNVTVKVVQLPHEDPALDLATRNDANYDLFRAWADMNWGTFFEDDGCEQYLSTLVVSDAAEGVHGIALVDVEKNRRVSFSWLDDLTRLTEEDGAPLFGAPLLGGRAASRETSRWATFVPVHETGHLFGLTHPHTAIRDADVEGERPPSRFTWAFSATWDSMTYQALDRIADYGAIAQANWHRNRVGFVLEAARHQELEGTPEFAAAVDLLKQYRWAEANAILLPKIEAGHDEGCARRC